MQIFRTLEEVPRGLGPLIASIGNFDGVHCGHRSVLRRVRERAATQALRSAVVTFDPHPARVLRPEQRRQMLTPLTRKLELLAGTGVDVALVLPFSEDVARMTARCFAEDVLRDRLQLRELHEGENFRLGHGAEADLSHLTALGAELGFAVFGYAPETMLGGVISSSRIRGLVAEGAVGQARRLLGNVFAVESQPARGRGIGSRLLVPTINLAPYPELLPGHGVYVTRMRVGGQVDGGEQWFEGVTNVGNRPTFGEDSFAVETYLLDYDPHAAGGPLIFSEDTPLQLEFLKRLRGEQRWESPEALRAQIGRDVGRAKRFLELRRRLVRPVG